MKNVELRDAVRLSVRKNIEGMVCEGVFDYFKASPLEKILFMFLEKGDERYFFMKSTDGSKILKAARYGGSVLIDVMDFKTEKELNDFADSKKKEGFRLLYREGEISTFIRKVSRGIAKLVMAFGAIAFLRHAIIALHTLFLGVDPISGTVMYGAAAGLKILAAGWILASLSTDLKIPKNLEKEVSQFAPTRA